MEYGSPDELKDVSTEELFNILKSDDPTERVWAAWEVSIRKSGQNAQHRINQRISIEKNAGVRRQLIVILAGNGETDTIKILSRCDPNHGVRFTACTYILKISSDISSDLKYIEERLLEDDSDLFRSLMLRHCLDIDLHISNKTIFKLIDSENINIRLLIHEYILKNSDNFKVFTKQIIDRIKSEEKRIIINFIKNFRNEYTWVEASNLSTTNDPEIREILSEKISICSANDYFIWLLETVRQDLLHPIPVDRPGQLEKAKFTAAGEKAAPKISDLISKNFINEPKDWIELTGLNEFFNPIIECEDWSYRYGYDEDGNEISLDFSEEYFQSDEYQKESPYGFLSRVISNSQPK